MAIVRDATGGRLLQLMNLNIYDGEGRVLGHVTGDEIRDIHGHTLGWMDHDVVVAPDWSPRLVLERDMVFDLDGDFVGRIEHFDRHERDLAAAALLTLRRPHTDLAA